MMVGSCEVPQRRGMGGVSYGLGIEFLAKPPKVLRLMVNNREQPAQEKQVSCLYRLDVTSKRRRGGWELNSKVVQPAIRTARLRPLRVHHLPTCAPPSTCSTSPVTVRASVR